MTDKENIITTEQPTEEVDYIAAIQELQNNTVSKDSYDKLRDENKRLLDALVSGQQIDIAALLPASADLLKSIIAKQGTDNLSWWKAVLLLRDLELAEGREDILMPFGSQVEISQDTPAKAQKLALGIKYCIDRAEGDPGIFRAFLDKITQDIPVRGVSK